MTHFPSITRPSISKCRFRMFFQMKMYSMTFHTLFFKLTYFFSKIVKTTTYIKPSMSLNALVDEKSRKFKAKKLNAMTYYMNFAYIVIHQWHSQSQNTYQISFFRAPASSPPTPLRAPPYVYTLVDEKSRKIQAKIFNATQFRIKIKFFHRFK